MLRLVRFLIFGLLVYFVVRFFQRLLRSFVTSGNPNPPTDGPAPPPAPPPIQAGDVKDATFRDIHEDEQRS